MAYRKHRRSFARRSLAVLLIAVALILIVAHALPLDKEIRVDQVTLGLLGFAALPFIGQLVTSFKAGGVEVALREMSEDEQVFQFLEAIATRDWWTFFQPRDSEADLGQAFKILTRQLLKRVETKFVSHLRVWLQADDLHLRWFAAEIIGFHRITALQQALLKAIETRDPAAPWPEWDLNCRWAAARLDSRPVWAFMRLLDSTSNPDNRRWILRSFDQMLGAKKFLSEEEAQLLRGKVRELVQKSGRHEISGLPELESIVPA